MPNVGYSSMMATQHSYQTSIGERHNLELYLLNDIFSTTDFLLISTCCTSEMYNVWESSTLKNIVITIFWTDVRLKKVNCSCIKFIHALSQYFLNYTHQTSSTTNGYKQVANRSRCQQQLRSQQGEVSFFLSSFYLALLVISE